MTRDYVTVRKMADIAENVNGENYLARTIYEPEELIDIGIVDHAGNKVMARKRIDPIGFIRWSDK